MREWIAAGFTRTEDVVYVGLAVLLAISALTLLVATSFGAAQALVAGELPSRVVITAELSDLLDRGETALRNAMIELGLLTLMLFVLVSSLVMLRRRGVAAAAERA
jgi:hypothetical protein